MKKILYSFVVFVVVAVVAVLVVVVVTAAVVVVAFVTAAVYNPNSKVEKVPNDWVRDFECALLREFREETPPASRLPPSAPPRTCCKQQLRRNFFG